MRSSVFAILGATLLALALVWALVLGWWQANDHTPSTAELLLYLGALPLSMIGGYWLLRGFIDNLKSTPVSAESVSGKADDPLAREPSATSVAERRLTLYLVDAFVSTAAGDSADEVLVSSEAGKRPAPDATLRDDDGFPVFAARLEALDVDAVSTGWAEVSGTPATDGRLRWLSLIDHLLSGAADRLREQLSVRPPEARLRLVWLVPAEVPSADFCGLKAWLETQYLSDFGADRCELVLRSVGSEAAVMAHLDGLVLAGGHQPSDADLHGVLAAGMAVDLATVQAWAAKGALFSAANQNGAVPGECALCLLFSGHSDEETVVRISRVNSAARDKPVDAGGRVTGMLLGQLAADLLELHELEPASIHAVVSDVDHRASRVGELLDAFGEAFETLDPSVDYPGVGSVCGATPPFGALLALACARAKVVSAGLPALCVTQQHPTVRAAILVLPPPQQVIDPSAVT